MRQFIFNDAGVCVNPETLPRRSNKMCNAEVTVAETPNGEWCYGLRVGTDMSWLTSCCCPDRQKRATRKEAIYAAWQQAEQFFADALAEAKGCQARGRELMPGEKSYDHQITALTDMLTQIRRELDLYDPRQLTIYDLL